MNSLDLSHDFLVGMRFQ